jgi:hypothetical protein
MGRKRKVDGDDPALVDAPALHLLTPHQRKQKKRLVVVLENALVESIKVFK